MFERKTRRQFLKGALAAGGGIAFAPSIISCAARSKEARKAPAAPPAGTLLDRFKERRGKLRKPRLVAGAAKVEITPRKAAGAMIAGFGCNRISKGVHDPIWARALFLDDGETSVAFVSLDLVGLFHNRVEKIRDRLSSKNSQSMIVCTTHNHEAPDSIGLWGRCLLYLLPVKSGVDEAWMETVEEKTARCVEAAISRARTATVSFGAAEVPDTLSENYIEPAEIDRGMRLMQARDLSGETIATLVNFGLHAECLWDENPYVTSDFAGSMYRRLEERYGGVALYLNGVLGGQIDLAYGYDVNPDGTAVPKERLPVEKLFEISERYGTELAGLAEGGLAKADIAGPDLKIKFKSERLSLPLENDGFMMAAKLGLIDRGFDGGKVRTEVDLVEIGPAQLVTIPGEPFYSIGKQALESLHAKHRFLVSMGNDELGYIMTEEQFAQPKFAYQQSVSAGSKTGTLILEAIKRLETDR